MTDKRNNTDEDKYDLDEDQLLASYTQFKTGYGSTSF